MRSTSVMIHGSSADFIHLLPTHMISLFLNLFVFKYMVLLLLLRLYVWFNQIRWVITHLWHARVRLKKDVKEEKSAHPRNKIQCDKQLNGWINKLIVVLRKNCKEKTIQWWISHLETYDSLGFPSYFLSNVYFPTSFTCMDWFSTSFPLSEVRSILAPHAQGWCLNKRN